MNVQMAMLIPWRIVSLHPVCMEPAFCITLQFSTDMFHLRHVHRIKPIAVQWRKRHYAQEKPVLTLFTKFVLEQVDITHPENTAWYERYKHDIPVFHLNGQFLMMHRVNIKKLERYLSKLEREDDVK
ncbi:glutaredoxin-like protein C5orf63 homolog isoform 2-T2 [Anomaloglossus baeobatrachus]|uniref:glutaredoxin-like protein C5orf63 homolog isoform X2 n=1 Tax=Anomaloglossus baeobatrachus TaxID=238106 RepID=UPI003F4FBB56